MCGIVGYVGKKEATPFLVGGLRRLEYRGYDSSGIATLPSNGGAFQLNRAVGKIDRLAELLDVAPMTGFTGIGHTRWATHGPATTENAHPHLGGRGLVAVVHNGVIEMRVGIFGSSGTVGGPSSVPNTCESSHR